MLRAGHYAGYHPDAAKVLQVPLKVTKCPEIPNNPTGETWRIPPGLLPAQ
jgi:hypothetical protein